MAISLSKTVTYPAEATEIASTQEPYIAPLWWRADDGADYALGWLIEQTDSAIAFLTRGQTTIEAGAKIDVANSDPAELNSSTTNARVSRIRHIHADLFLIAAQR